jgi:hypothetical protein
MNSSVAKKSRIEPFKIKLEDVKTLVTNITITNADELKVVRRHSIYWTVPTDIIQIGHGGSIWNHWQKAIYEQTKLRINQHTIKTDFGDQWFHQNGNLNWEVCENQLTHGADSRPDANEKRMVFVHILAKARKHWSQPDNKVASNKMQLLNNEFQYLGDDYFSSTSAYLTRL